ncbi:MAG: SARP family transcriptional regulator, partial [Actinomycetota bacterium]|nr:SARP family transcriptional regulator [Actinomycetota bacterium]
ATLRALVAHSRGDWHQQIEIDLLDTSRAPQLAASVHDGHLCVVEHYLYGSRPYHELIAFAHRLRAAAQHSGAERGFAFATLVLGEAELLAGHHAAAGLHLREAVELHHRVGSAAGQSLALQRYAELDLIAGDGSEAASLLAQALELARQSTLLGRHLLPRIYGTMIDAAAGTAQSLAVVEEAESAVAPTEACRMCRVTFTLPAARACARAGDQHRAQDYLAAAREVAPPASRGVAWTAAMAETEAVLAEAAGHATAATSLQRDAAQLYAAAGQTHDASRCRAVACAPAEPVREAAAGRDTGAGKVSVRQSS